jgi:hypothetical protein
MAELGVDGIHGYQNEMTFDEARATHEQNHFDPRATRRKALYSWTPNFG